MTIIHYYRMKKDGTLYTERPAGSPYKYVHTVQLLADEHKYLQEIYSLAIATAVQTTPGEANLWIEKCWDDNQ